MMDRRRFLRWLGGTAAGVAIAPTLDLDRLLWVPGAKTIFLPTLEPVRFNTFITPQWIVREMAATWKNQLTFMQDVNRSYDVTYPAASAVTLHVSGWPR